MQSVSFSITRVNRLRRAAATARFVPATEDQDLSPEESLSDGWSAGAYDPNTLMSLLTEGAGSVHQRPTSGRPTSGPATQRAAGPSFSARNASVAASRSRHTTFWFAKILGMVYASETATV